MEIIKIPIDQLSEDSENAKDHPKWQVEQIKNSIEQFGNLDPIGVWGDDNLVVEGNGRLQALRELGYQEAECIRLDWLSEEERRAYALVHNKLTMNSGFIPEMLDMNLDCISEIDMSLFGFDIGSVDGDSEEAVEERPGNLTEEFGQVPFSVLYATRGDWADRKRAWINLGIRSEEGRGDALAYRANLFKEMKHGTNIQN